MEDNVVSRHINALNLLILALRSSIAAAASCGCINIENYRPIFDNDKNNSKYQISSVYKAFCVISGEPSHKMLSIFK